MFYYVNYHTFQFYKYDKHQYAIDNVNRLLQVRFNSLSSVVRVATRGEVNANFWITLFRLAYSEDCVVFNNLLDGAGNNIVIVMFVK